MSLCCRFGTAPSDGSSCALGVLAKFGKRRILRKSKSDIRDVLVGEGNVLLDVLKLATMVSIWRSFIFSKKLIVEEMRSERSFAS